MRRRASWGVVGTVVVVLFAAGCGTVSSPGFTVPGDASDAMGLAVAGVSCMDTGFGPDANSAPSMTPLPASFVPVAVTRCRLSESPVPGDGVWLDRIEERADTGLAALTQELRTPNEQTGANQLCPAIGYIPTIITLVDAGGATLVPAIPTVTCGAPRSSAIAAIQALSWQQTGQTRVRQLRSELEVSSGCSSGYKPVVAVIARDGRATDPATGPVFPTGTNQLRVCKYDLGPEPIDFGGLSLHVGTLAGVSTVDGERLTTLLAALANAPRATGACSSVEAPFAVVTPDGGNNPTVYVELGGCYRYVRDGSDAVRQLDATTVAMLG